MNQNLIEAYKKLDYIKEYECDMNISTVLEVLNKWNKKAGNNNGLKKVIEAFLEIQWHIIELKRDRDLAMKSLVKYKLQRDESLKQKNELALKLKKYEDKHFNRDTRRGKR